jgi:hypothetical protein
MLPVPAGAFQWIEKQEEVEYLGGGIFIYRVSSALQSSLRGAVP